MGADRWSHEIGFQWAWFALWFAVWTLAALGAAVRESVHRQQRPRVPRTLRTLARFERFAAGWAPGRWILVGVLGSLTLICLDIVRLRWFGGDANTFAIFALRLPLCLFLPWGTVRSASVGLTGQGPNSSVPNNLLPWRRKGGASQ